MTKATFEKIMISIKTFFMFQIIFARKQKLGIAATSVSPAVPVPPYASGSSKILTGPVAVPNLETLSKQPRKSVPEFISYFF